VVAGEFRFAEKSEKSPGGERGVVLRFLLPGTGVGRGNRVAVPPGYGIWCFPRFRGARGRCLRRPGADLGDAGNLQRGIGDGDTFADAEVFAAGAAKGGENERGFLLKMSAGGTGQVQFSRAMEFAEHRVGGYFAAESPDLGTPTVEV